MSRFSYTYDTLFSLQIKHPESISVKNHVVFTPSEDTSQIFKELKLHYRTTETGFLIGFKTASVFKETMDTYGNPITKTKESFDWLDVSNLNHTLEFYCIASKAFIENTQWEDLGPRKPEPNEDPLTYSYNLYKAIYKAVNSAPDLNAAPDKTDYTLENDDYNRMQVAKIELTLSGHIPNETHKNNTLII